MYVTLYFNYIFHVTTRSVLLIGLHQVRVYHRWKDDINLHNMKIVENPIE